MIDTLPWWQQTTIYQIYPRSYLDSNKDGIGDIQGIISKLDYIQNLGFETIWISPFFASPNQDFGYDVCDYLSISSEYGTLADVDELIAEVHSRGMRILFDWVINHTSNQHPWFQESSSSRENPKRDWYIWRDGKGKNPPNNWKSITGGSGWHYDKATNQFYFASFLPFQPDLNWRNNEVKQMMLDICKFWLDRGIDGFRIDIFHTVYKEENFQNNPFSWHLIPRQDQAGFFQQWTNTMLQPEVFLLAKELRSIFKTYSHQPMMIGEVFGREEIVKKFLGENSDGLHLIFLWRLLNIKEQANYLRRVIRLYEVHFPPPQIPVYVFGNHDTRRLSSNVKQDQRVIKLLVVFQFTVRGVPVTYYGEEIGMANFNLSQKTALDPIGRKYKYIPGFLFNLFGYSINRDGCRTPMQWDDSANAGFCDSECSPWLPIHKNRKWVNVRSQDGDPQSILNIYKAVLALRKAYPALRLGKIELIEDSAIDKNILAYRRNQGNKEVIVVLNFSKKRIRFQNPKRCKQLLLAVNMNPPLSLDDFQLDPYSGVMIRNYQ